MSDTPRWLAGWYATRLHAVDRPFDPSSIRPIYAMCNAHVYASPQSKWAARRLAKNPPKCKRCVKLLGQADAPSEVEQLRAEVERLSSPATWQDECADVEAAFLRSGVRPTWPDDEVANIGPMAAAMADEIDRLRADVERGYLSEAERQALKTAIHDYEGNDMDAGCWQVAATLRGLLARLGGGE